MSVLPPKADIDERDGDVRFVPKADIVPRSEHLVGARDLRQVETESRLQL